MTKAPILIVAGGTGGHVFPALAVAIALRQQGEDVVWLGTQAGLEARLVPAAGIPLLWIKVSGLRGKGWQRWLQAPFMVGYALVQALLTLRRVGPRRVLGMGGFVSGPAGAAAWLSGIPLLIHEQNAVAGLTNRLLSRLARTVMAAFPDTFPTDREALTVGNPVREEIHRLPPPEQRFAGRQGSLRLLVLGGSQGARALNQVLPAALALLPVEQRPEVRHQTGTALVVEAETAYRKQSVAVSLEPFIEDMAAAYAWADLVICRSGALTVAELAAAGVGAILVPYPHAVDDHQTRNAEFLVDGGAARLVSQAVLTPARLAELLAEVLTADRQLLITMAQAARQLARPHATAEIVAHCREDAVSSLSEKSL